MEIKKVNLFNRILPVAMLAALTGGCATMSKEECRTADWRMIGYEDGAAGRPVAQLSKRREACADHGVRPDMAAYRAGREEGLELYCTEHSGFRMGRSGGGYNGVCPAELEGLFLHGYEAGRELYLAWNAVHQVSNAINSREQEREHLLDDITTMSAQLIADETTSEERITLLADIKRTKKRRGELRREIRDLKQELALREAEYQDVQSHSPYQ